MAKFKFKFESVQKVKSNLEKKAQKELALLEKEIEQKKNEYTKVLEEELLAEKKLTKNSIKVSEIKHYEVYIVSTKKKLANIQKEIDDLETKKKNKISELIKKSQDHKIFNILEEIQLQDFNNMQNSLEEKLFDEMATQKFLREKA
jgi:flagellar FliJ protein